MLILLTKLLGMGLDYYGFVVEHNFTFPIKSWVAGCGTR